jgi:iron complex transport system permease protein
MSHFFINHEQHRKAFWLAASLLIASGIFLLLGASVGSTGFESVMNMTLCHA